MASPRKRLAALLASGGTRSTAEREARVEVKPVVDYLPGRLLYRWNNDQWECIKYVRTIRPRKGTTVMYEVLAFNPSDRTWKKTKTLAAFTKPCPRAWDPEHANDEH